ncbi:hypothetical protein CAL7102_05035 [Dulcicalothrix desertica PCC 7102]|nr:hypothetical protein CAL7102_05035 [Dulcicalothrix desertica PCC 7102]
MVYSLEQLVATDLIQEPLLRQEFLHQLKLHLHQYLVLFHHLTAKYDIHDINRLGEYKVSNHYNFCLAFGNDWRNSFNSIEAPVNTITTQ